MKVDCAVGGCNWNELSGSLVDLEAMAELHRRDRHDWVKRGRCHRWEFEEHELADVDRRIEELGMVRLAAASSGQTIYRGHSGSRRQVG